LVIEVAGNCTDECCLLKDKLNENTSNSLSERRSRFVDWKRRVNVSENKATHEDPKNAHRLR
jgi:hypothetical protein